MEKAINSKSIYEKIRRNEMVILYFSSINDDVCESIKYKISRILEFYPNVKSIEIEGEKHMDIAAANDVFSFSQLILCVNGRETVRIGKNGDFLELEKNIKRYYDLLYKVWP